MNPFIKIIEIYNKNAQKKISKRNVLFLIAIDIIGLLFLAYIIFEQIIYNDALYIELNIFLIINKLIEILCLFGIIYKKKWGMQALLVYGLTDAYICFHYFDISLGLKMAAVILPIYGILRKNDEYNELFRISFSWFIPTKK